MPTVVFLYSGEGTSDRGTSAVLLKYSPRWKEIAQIVKRNLGVDLEAIWTEEIGTHRCPHSPLLTAVAQICLADIWTRWGYAPSAVIGHSIGELAAAYQAGLYTLEETLMLAHRIGNITAKLEGAMLHGKLTQTQIADLAVHLSALNFKDGDHTHVTVCGPEAQMAAFLKEHPDFVKMRLPHPWHHPDYGAFADQLDVPESRLSESISFLSGMTHRFENQLDEQYWKRWLTGTVDFIDAMQAMRQRFPDEGVQIIEIGFHPVLERCCAGFDRQAYASSMFRGEDNVRWILHQRKRLDPEPFVAQLKNRVADFNDQLEFKTSLAYQGLTSITFVEFTEQIEPLFPTLAPQDFYRFKSIDQLISGFGGEPQEESAAILKPQKNGVVIAGMSCRFPSDVQDLPQYWRMLTGRRDQVRRLPERGAFEAGFLDDAVSRFDHRYFNIAEAEARTMDPQQIMALELAELLWRDAGIAPQTLDRKRVGVYIGAWNQEYAGRPDSVYYPTGTNPSIIAARISYHYDLRGPSWVSNTACSSSLVALHYAAKDIEAGRVDYAIAGGVNMILGRRFTDSMRRSGFLSNADRCKTFDDGADGYGRAEGGGLVLLVNKSLANRHYAELAGSAINQNGGRAQVITAPHPEAQEEVIMEACREAGITPQQIAYLECHGTGTKIGDPIEVSAIQNTVARDRNGTCYLGSVKSNLGHLESAAGIAGLIKSVLALNSGTLPPNLHFNRPNSYIDFDAHRLKVVTEETPIDHEAYIGVSSFGFGGSNAHIVIRGASDAVRKTIESDAGPFTRDQAPPLTAYYPEEPTTEPAHRQQATQEASTEEVITETTIEGGSAAETPGPVTRARVDGLIKELFFSLTGIDTIDPDMELTEQGLDSMSITELISQMETILEVDLDPDLVFDFPLVDQLAKKIFELAQEKN